MERWEYKVYYPEVLGNAQAEFNELGQQGWELVYVYDGKYNKGPVFFFKRKG
ncbi:MAG: hypothetical protein LBB75_06040 [Oscillospiraceae bacterium]|jgi:hypothetical protein|nr:hypothetical protein [Oscillospiraceae bacterium]